MEFRTAPYQITPTELKKQLDSGRSITILDVREDRELAVSKLANNVHIPLGQLEHRLAELQSHKDEEIVVYCRSGQRSDRACQLLRSHGFKKVMNLQGGILSWSDEVDPTVQKY